MKYCSTVCTRDKRYYFIYGHTRTHTHTHTNVHCRVLTKLIPGSLPAYQSLQENRERWKKLRDDKQYPGPSLPMLTA